MMGTILGAIRGQTTEAGFLDGAGKGAVAGAIAALEFLELVAFDEPFSKVILQSPHFAKIISLDSNTGFIVASIAISILEVGLCM